MMWKHDWTSSYYQYHLQIGIMNPWSPFRFKSWCHGENCIFYDIIAYHSIVNWMKDITNINLGVCKMYPLTWSRQSLIKQKLRAESIPLAIILFDELDTVNTC